MRNELKHSWPEDGIQGVALGDRDLFLVEVLNVREPEEWGGILAEVSLTLEGATRRMEELKKSILDKGWTCELRVARYVRAEEGEKEE